MYFILLDAFTYSLSYVTYLDVATPPGSPDVFLLISYCRSCDSHTIEVVLRAY